MNPILVSALVFVSIFAGAVVGMALRNALPDEQLGPDSKEVVRLATSLIVTMSGLVLGLLVSSASTSYQGQKNDVAGLASHPALRRAEVRTAAGPVSLAAPPGFRHGDASLRPVPSIGEHSAAIRAEFRGKAQPVPP